MFIFYQTFPWFKLLPKTKISDWSKSEDHKMNVAKMMIYVFDRVENIVGKEKMLVTSIFFFSNNGFKSPFVSELLKLRIVGKGFTNEGEKPSEIIEKTRTLVASIFSISFTVFYPFTYKYHTLGNPDFFHL